MSGVPPEMGPNLLESTPEQLTLDDLVLRLDQQMRAAPGPRNRASIIALYRETFPKLEQALWSGTLDDSSVAKYQRVFRDYEALIAAKDRDDRHHIIIVIPVADRPQHLTQCLSSVLTLCECFNYGGYGEGYYNKIRVVIADDSAQPDSISRHKKIAEQFDRRGLRTEYFGLGEQVAQIRQLDEQHRAALTRVVGDTDNLDPARFSHKGASITRNIAYLRLQRLVNEMGTHRTLIQFVDSDQEFCVILPDERGSRTVYAVNYFHHIDEIFTNTDVSILTGKVVGDPPVSPSVMAGHFADDIIDFLSRQARLQPEHHCEFHQRAEATVDAAYHDLARLFGFGRSRQSCRYRCTLKGEHSNADCLVDFARKLNRFFYGEHPTRVTYFNYQGRLSNTTPARTIYTGNYVFRPECIKWFIPFATLKLRMAGPVLGRLLKAELGGRFVSANLPMLHKRILAAVGESEFRPDVNKADDLIDLSGEFERQYFGDVMLFTVEALTEQGFPAEPTPESRIKQLLFKVERKLHQQYHIKHREIITKLNTLTDVLEDPAQKWYRHPGFQFVRKELSIFIACTRHNFDQDSKGWRLINSKTDRRIRLNQIAEAIMNYAHDQVAWRDALG